MEHQKNCKVHGLLDSKNIIVEPNKSAKRGYTLRCKICKKDKEQRYKETHRKELCEKNKIYKAQNRDIVNDWNKKDRKENPEKYRQYEANYIAKYGREHIRKTEVARIQGLTIPQYEALFVAQCDKCKICGKEETRTGSGGDLAPLGVDHCHQCRDAGHKGLLNVRGLLCHECNKGLGGFKDNIDLMQNAIEYLKQHKHSEGD